MSYLELAPLLAERVEDAEVEILERKFAEVPVPGLLYRLGFPVINAVAASMEETKGYFEVLQAHDWRDVRLWSEI